MRCERILATVASGSCLLPVLSLEERRRREQSSTPPLQMKEQLGQSYRRSTQKSRDVPPGRGRQRQRQAPPCCDRSIGRSHVFRAQYALPAAISAKDLLPSDYRWPRAKSVLQDAQWVRRSVTQPTAEPPRSSLGNLVIAVYRTNRGSRCVSARHEMQEGGCRLSLARWHRWRQWTILRTQQR